MPDCPVVFAVSDEKQKQKNTIILDVKNHAHTHTMHGNAVHYNDLPMFTTIHI